MASHGLLSISPEHSEMILAEMCQRVGVKYSDVDFSKSDWFRSHTWTAKQEDDFRIWLGKFLRKHHYVGSGKKRGQDWGYYEAGKLVFNYGWKCDYEHPNIQKAEPLIKDILSKYPETRGDDLELIIKVWEAQGLKFTDSQKTILRKCYSSETIRRTRQKIQETGLFRPSPQVQQQRTMLEDEFRSYFREN